jgi:5-methylcytosine-specific restriction endonuclease McrA
MSACSPTVRKIVLDRDGHKCLRCGKKHNLTIDHIKPKCKGGTSEPKNLQTLCWFCNQSKKAFTLDYRTNSKTDKNITTLMDIRERIEELKRITKQV